MTSRNTTEPSAGAGNPTTMIATLMVGSFVAILNQTLMISALPTLMREFAVPSSTVQWLTTGFMLANGIMIPVTAFLVETFTTRQLFLYAMGMFFAGSLVCALAPNFALLLTGRIVQACGAGMLMTLLQTVLFRVYPPERRGQAMGMFGMVIAFAPAIGPTVSGLLVEWFSWRWMFALLAVIAGGVIVAAWFTVRNVGAPTHPHIDVPSVVLSTLGFGGILFAFSTAGKNGWGSVDVLVALAVGAVALVVFIMRQLRLDQPMLDFRIFRIPMFTLCLGISVIGFAAFMGVENVIPLYLQNDLGVDALESGLLMMPGGIVMGALNPVTGRLYDRFGGRPIAIAGFAILTAAAVLLATMDAHTPVWMPSAYFALLLAGSAFCSMPLVTAALNQLSGAEIPHGTAMNNTMRQTMGAISIALLVTIMNTHASAAEAAGVDAPEASALGVRASFRDVAIVCAACLVAAFFVHDRGRRTTSPGSRSSGDVSLGE
ncbi:MDR family MFS transporter [Bifidobacterium callitrichos]|uniref:MDR family MFS transporter n=1 Tax=Bifidobacterium callitrichos TaxID=762209 RepID=UPI0015E64F89|nr:MDR family MFS transporter [Bifidobacterium callitrichos]